LNHTTAPVPRLAHVVLAICALALLVPAQASAAKRIVDQIGTSESVSGGAQGGQFNANSPLGGVAVNHSGAGGADPGDVYVLDAGNSRVQQFTSSGEFVRLWGMGVVSGTPAFEICEIASECGSAVSTGTAAKRHPGSLFDGGGNGGFPRGLEVDQTTGHVYVALSGTGLNRVAIFSTTGEPLGAFGWGVLDGSAELQFCTVASGCLAGGDPGGAPGGELGVGGGDGEMAFSPAGELYLVGTANGRVDVFEPAVAGGAVTDVAFKRAFGWDVVRTGPGDSSLDETQRLTVRATAGTYKLRLELRVGIGVPDTDPIAFDASAPVLEAELNSVLAAAGGTVTVSGGPGDATGSVPYEIEFGGSLSGDDVPDLEAFHGLLSGGSPASAAIVETLQDGGGFETCVLADGDTCQRASIATAATEPGHFNSGGIGNSNPVNVKINPVNGDVYVLDSAGGLPVRIHRFDSGDTPIDGDFGAAALGPAIGSTATALAIDPDSGNLLVAGQGVGSGGQMRVAELDADGDLIDLHGPDLTVGSTGGIAATPLAAGGNLYLTAGKIGTLVGAYVLAEGKPQIDPLASCATTTELSGTVFSDGESVSYRFEYVTEEEFQANGFDAATRVPAVDVSVGPAPAEIDVAQQVSGLTGSQAYRFRLVATREGLARASDAVTCTTDPAPPAVSPAGVIADETGALLQARVNPQNEPTTYRFEYVTEAEFQANGWTGASRTPALADADVPAGNLPALVAQEIDGLQAGAEYRSRVVAANGTPPETTGAEQSFKTLSPYQDPVTGPCPNEELRGGPSVNLPNCRAYELVSPPAAPTINGVISAYVSDTGQALTYRVNGAFAGTPQNTANLYGAKRSGAGWSTTPLSPPLSNQAPPDLQNLFSHELRVFSEDFSRVAYVTQEGLDEEDDDLGPNAGQGSDLYLRRPDGSFAWITSPPITGVDPNVLAASADATHLLMSGADGNFYEWVEGVPSEVRQINVLPGGAPCPKARAGDFNGDYESTGTSFGSMSADGRRSFFECDTLNANANPSVASLWLREDGAVTEPVADPGVFAGATKDGSAVFFVSIAPYVPADDNGAVDLYRYEVDAGQYTRLTPDSLAGPADPRLRIVPSAGVVLSDDGERVYFVARGVLSADPNANGQSAIEGIDNLYVWDEGTVRFVASPQTGQAGGRPLRVGTTAGSVFGNGAPTEWDIAPDGAYLAFATEDALLPGDGDSVTDIYVYDLAARTLALASTGPRGDDGSFVARMNIGGSRNSTRRPRALGAGPDGAYLFFQTKERLVTRDVNNATDVYQRDLRTGQTWLISSGEAALDALLIGASLDGSTVAFLDPRPLAPQDRDGEMSVYVARVGGGFAAEVSPTCAGEGCKGDPPTSTPPPPASTRFSGTGNLRPESSPRCGKGKRRVVRRGKARCVRKQQRKVKRARAERRDRRGQR
jgi:hypothetical protein